MTQMSDSWSLSTTLARESLPDMFLSKGDRSSPCQAVTSSLPSSTKRGLPLMVRGVKCSSEVSAVGTAMSQKVMYSAHGAAPLPGHSALVAWLVRACA